MVFLKRAVYVKNQIYSNTIRQKCIAETTEVLRQTNHSIIEKVAVWALKSYAHHYLQYSVMERMLRHCTPFYGTLRVVNWSATGYPFQGKS